jgi:hypothetical protein
LPVWIIYRSTDRASARQRQPKVVA